MSETTKNRLYLMITITNRVMGATHFLDFYRAFGAPVVFTALGRGTASNDVLSYLGLEATEKSVMFSVVTPAVKEVLMRELDLAGLSVPALAALHRNFFRAVQQKRDSAIA